MLAVLQHQISVDVPAIAAGYDRVLSTVLLYEPERRVVRLDRAPDKALAGAAAQQQRAAVGVAEALRATAELAAASWTPAVWNRLMAARTRRMPVPTSWTSPLPLLIERDGRGGRPGPDGSLDKSDPSPFTGTYSQ